MGRSGGAHGARNAGFWGAMRDEVHIETARGRLRSWRDADLADFAAMHADPQVQWDLGHTLSEAAASAKLARYRECFEARGFTRWAMVDPAGSFLGYVGVLPISPGHPLGEGVEIGGRFRRAAWGHGYASEGAAAALEDLRARCGLGHVFSFTAPDNLRSQAVMGRIGLRRRPDLDFVQAGTDWRGWVWST